jgi:Tol biopolymer transport system component
MAPMGEATRVGTSSDRSEGTPASSRFAWLTLFLAAWIIVGLAVLRYGIDNGLVTDIVVSVYHIPFYLGIVAIGLVCLVLVVRAVRDGRGWRRAFPQGYGVLGVGFLMLLAWPIADIGWREGVGLNRGSAEELLAPNRLLIFFGATLVAVGPLRAALASQTSSVARWPAVVSAALVFTLVSTLDFLPAQRPWLQAARLEPEVYSEVWVMNGDGSAQTRLIEAADGFEFSAAVWSPDGTRIAYTRDKPPERLGVNTDDQAIWICSADGTNRRLLIDGIGWYWLPKWSPDGQWIVYTIDGQRGPGAAAGVAAPDFGFGQPPGFGQPQSVAPNVDVWRIRSDGSGAPERLTEDPAEDRAGVYSPDGRRLLFDSTRAAGRTGIYVMDADGSHTVRATFFGDDWGGTWSPDGTRIAFNANPSGGPYDIYVTNFPVTGTPVRLTDDPESDARPSWSPDGTRIAFDTERDGEQDVWSVAADGSDLRNLTRTIGASDGLAPGGGAWGPDGRILFSRSQDPPAFSSSVVRENLGIPVLLFGALILAILVLAVVRIGAPFGTVAVITGLATAFAALGSGEWRFLPAAVIGGLVVDILVRLAPADRKQVLAGAGSAAALVFGAGLTVIATTGMAWRPTLLLGVTLVAAALGAGMAALIGRARPSGERT